MQQLKLQAQRLRQDLKRVLGEFQRLKRAQGLGGSNDGEWLAKTKQPQQSLKKFEGIGEELKTLGFTQQGFLGTAPEHRQGFGKAGSHWYLRSTWLSES